MVSEESERARNELSEMAESLEEEHGENMGEAADPRRETNSSSLDEAA